MHGYCFVLSNCSNPIYITRFQILVELVLTEQNKGENNTKEISIQTPLLIFLAYLKNHPNPNRSQL